MPRIIGIDYGMKRTGIAITDELQIAVHPYKTVASKDLIEVLLNYLEQEEVELIVFGFPTHTDGTPTYLTEKINKICLELKKKTTIDIKFQDESYTSVEAKEIMIQGGMKKKKRRDKSMVDLISAVLILQRYLKHIP